jgi:RNA polymerase sigma factor (sigma-70 family)
MTDQEILDGFKNVFTANKAMEALIDKYQKKLYWQIRKMVLDADAAKDICQDALIKIWKNINNFKGDSQLYTWIYRIGVNEALSYLAKEKKRNYSDLDQLENIAKADTNIGDIDGATIELKLNKALLTLPDKQRLVFNLKYYDNLSYDEISAITGTSVGALKASYHHATKKIEEFVLNN